MGYTTEFRGKFNLNKPLTATLLLFLTNFSNTRRMGRQGLDAKYGVEGEFFCEDTANFGQNSVKGVIDFNTPPVTQPGLWCQWTPTEDGKSIEWNGGEKFYSYIEWIEYLIQKILAPNGYVLNGAVRWRGEDFDDDGTIRIEDNVVFANGEVINNQKKIQTDVVWVDSETAQKFDQSVINKWVGRDKILLQQETDDQLHMLVESTFDDEEITTKRFLRFFTVGNKTMCSVDWDESLCSANEKLFEAFVEKFQ